MPNLHAPHDLEVAAVAVFVALFAIVTVLGFAAARWRPADLGQLDEWGLAGRRFGGVTAWFLLGADIYTAYTFLFVPAVLFGSGSYAFFALPYTIIVFPLMFVVMPRLWTVCHRHGYVTAADLVRGRFGSPTLALVVALTGLLATMPYIAVQLKGLEVILDALGIWGPTEVPLVVAFALLAAYTYHSGLRAPALIGIAKDVLIFVTVLVVTIHVSSKLGGFADIFDAARNELPAWEKSGGVDPALLPTGAYTQQAYATLALGSALALLLYPHIITGVLSAQSPGVVRRISVALPAYSLVLGLAALMGYMFLATPVVARKDHNYVVPDLLIENLPPAMYGFAFAAIAIAAIVPVAIMSIAAANLFTRNIYKEYLRRDADDRDEARVARLVSLVVKLGALVFVIFIDTAHTLDLQLLGGVWILQTLPAVIVGLYTDWLDRRALLAGWAAGMITGTVIFFLDVSTAIFTVDILGVELSAYEALYALTVNGIVTVLATIVLRRREVAPVG
jgi:SSS family solute:Na+ symporter